MYAIYNHVTTHFPTAGGKVRVICRFWVRH